MTTHRANIVDVGTQTYVAILANETVDPRKSAVAILVTTTASDILHVGELCVPTRESSNDSSDPRGVVAQSDDGGIGTTLKTHYGRKEKEETFVKASAMSKGSSIQQIEADERQDQTLRKESVADGDASS